MDPSERDATIAGWWEHHRLSMGTRDQRKALEGGCPVSAVAAHRRVDQLVAEGEAGVVQFLADLNDGGPEDNEGEWVGAGPLEELVHRHGEILIDDIDRLARQSPSFRQALAYVWFSRGALAPKTEKVARAMGRLMA